MQATSFSDSDHALHDVNMGFFFFDAPAHIRARSIIIEQSPSTFHDASLFHSMMLRFAYRSLSPPYLQLSASASSYCLRARKVSSLDSLSPLPLRPV
jgi:hypothetical protein